MPGALERRLVAALAAAALASGERAEADQAGCHRPVITGNLVYATVDVFWGAASAAYTGLEIDKLASGLSASALNLWESEPARAARKLAAEKTDALLAFEPVPDIRKLFAEHTDEPVKDLRKLAAERVELILLTARAAEGTEVHESIYKPANALAKSIVQSMEKRVPEFRGMVDDGVLSFVLFVLYVAFVLQLARRCVRFVLAISWGIVKLVVSPLAMPFKAVTLVAGSCCSRKAQKKAKQEQPLTTNEVIGSAPVEASTPGKAEVPTAAEPVSTSILDFMLACLALLIIALMVVGAFAPLALYGGVWVWRGLLIYLFGTLYLQFYQEVESRLLGNVKYVKETRESINKTMKETEAHKWLGRGIRLVVLLIVIGLFFG